MSNRMAKACNTHNFRCSCFAFKSMQYDPNNIPTGRSSGRSLFLLLLSVAGVIITSCHWTGLNTWVLFDLMTTFWGRDWYPILQMKQLKPREVSPLAQEHPSQWKVTLGRWQLRPGSGWDLSGRIDLRLFIRWWRHFWTKDHLEQDKPGLFMTCKKNNNNSEWLQFHFLTVLSSVFIVPIISVGSYPRGEIPRPQ